MKTKAQVAIFSFMALLLAALVGVGLLLSLNGCASTPVRPTLQWPEFKKIEAQPILPVQPGDEKIEQVTVGEMRNAVAVAKAYDTLVPWFNTTVDYASASVEKGKALEKWSYELEKMNKTMLVATSVSTGFGIGSLLALFINAFVK